MNAVPTIFLVDDDQVVLNSYAALLRSMQLTFETFSSGRAFLEQYDPQRPGCLVLDVRMPDLTGPEIQERLSKMEPCLPIVFVSGFVDVRTAVKMVQLGALDFLQKGGSDMELLATIQRALQLDAENRRQIMRRRDVTSLLRRLSTPERDVLELVLEGAANKNIAGALQVSRRCVEDRRASIMSKLEVESVPALVRLVCEYNQIHNASSPAPSALFRTAQQRSV